MSTISGVSGSGNAWATASTQRNHNHQAKMFAKVDTNGDGSVDQAELGTMLDKISQKTGTSLGDTAKVFASMDTNGDGSLSSDELGKGMKSIMPPPPSTMDFAQAHQGGPSGGGGGPQGAGGSSSASTTFDPLDTNQDGTVSEAERLAGDTKTDPLQALFKAIDTDSDGKISPSETDVFAKKLTDLVSQSSNSTTSTATTADASQANATGFDISKLAQMLYDKVASNLSQSANSSSLNAIA
jgi:Ca2+-binding EF-hand superfamily protein